MASLVACPAGVSPAAGMFGRIKEISTVAFGDHPRPSTMIGWPMGPALGFRIKAGLPGGGTTVGGMGVEIIGVGVSLGIGVLVGVLVGGIGV